MAHRGTVCGICWRNMRGLKYPWVISYIDLNLDVIWSVTRVEPCHSLDWTSPEDIVRDLITVVRVHLLTVDLASNQLQRSQAMLPMIDGGKPLSNIPNLVE